MTFAFVPPFPRALHLPLYEAHIQGNARRSTVVTGADVSSARRSAGVWLGVHWKKVRVARSAQLVSSRVA